MAMLALFFFIFSHYYEIYGKILSGIGVHCQNKLA